MRAVSLFLLLTLLGGCSFNSTFFPTDNRTPSSISLAHEVVILKADDGRNIHHVLFTPRSVIRASIVLFHGSGSTVANWAHVIEPLVDAGFQVFMMEYRGFGLSEGRANHRNTAGDATRAVQFFLTSGHVKGKPLLVMGQSYGGQPAIYASERMREHIDGLILEGAFTSFKEIAIESVPVGLKTLTRVVFATEYEAIELMHSIDAPVLVIHSKDDSVVPFEMGMQLFEAAAGRKEMLVVRGNHVDALLDNPDQVIQSIRAMIGE